jgi:hypothetical protein
VRRQDSEGLRIAAQTAWLGRSAKKSTMMSRPLHNTASKTFIMRITDIATESGLPALAQHGEQVLYHARHRCTQARAAHPCRIAADDLPR